MSRIPLVQAIAELRRARTPGTVALYLDDPDRKLAYQWSWSLGVSQQLGSVSALGIDYVANVSRDQVGIIGEGRAARAAATAVTGVGECACPKVGARHRGHRENQCEQHATHRSRASWHKLIERAPCDRVRRPATFVRTSMDLRSGTVLACLP